MKRGSLTSKGRAYLAAVVFVPSAALAAPATAVEPPAPGTQADQPAPPEDVPPYFTNPTFRDAFEAAKQRLERQQQRRESPTAAAERLASRSSYQGLGAAEALDVAEQTHGEAILEPAWDPIGAQPGSRLEGYLGDFAARIDVPGQPTDSLLESTLPLRARTDSGQIAPVDQELVADEGALAPANPITELSTPDELPGEIQLPDAGVGIEPLGVDATPARLAGETTAFYANALTDTDLAVRELPTGVSADYVLRSVRSPEQFSLQLTLPPGAHLEQRGDEGAAIVRDGEEIGRIAPPAAWDADGQGIPVSWEIKGTTLTVSVRHRGRDLLYPAYLDPTVVLENQRGWPDFTGWQQVENPWTNRFDGFATDWFWGRGLYTAGWCCSWFPKYSLASWEFPSAGPEAYIYVAEYNTVNLWGAYHYGTNWPFSYVNEGIWSYERGDWDPGFEYDAWYRYNGGSPRVITDRYLTGRTTTHCLLPIEWGCPPVNWNGQPAGTPGNHMVLMTWTDAPQGWLGGTNSNDFYTHMGGAAIWQSDLTPPQNRFKSYTVNGNTTTNPPSNWVDTANMSVVTEASDRGLGVKTYKLKVSGLTTDKTRTVSCSGDRTDRCPNTGAWWPSDSNDPDDPVTGDPFQWTTAAPVPEGSSDVEAWAEDYSTNASPKSKWEIKVDRSPPVIEQLSGSLAPGGNGEGTDLRIYATDGDVDANLLPRSARRSGVREIHIKVRGGGYEREYVEYPEQPCTRPEGSCDFDLPWDVPVYDFPTNDLHIEVWAKDMLGHPSEPIPWDVHVKPGPEIVRINCGEDIDPCQAGPQPNVGIPGWLPGGADTQTAVYALDRFDVNNQTSDPDDDISDEARKTRGVQAIRLFLPDGRRLDRPVGCDGEGEPQCPAGSSGQLFCGETGLALCPPYAGRTFSYSVAGLPEGVSQIIARAKDPRGRVSEPFSFPIKFDRTPPVLEENELLASLPPEVAGHRLLVPGQTYDLDIGATDHGAQGALNSGVHSVEVLVDGHRRFFEVQKCDLGDCRMDSVFKLRGRDYSNGDHTAEVVVTDGVGQTDSYTFTFTVNEAPTLPPGSDRLGLEQFFQYDSTETGQSAAHINLATGNAVWHKVPIVDPGRGLSTVVNLTYNSFDYPATGDILAQTDSRLAALDYDEAGLGFSLGISGLSRVNEPLTGVRSLLPAPLGTSTAPGSITLVDPDGTAHAFALNVDEALAGRLVYDPPPGVNLRLREYDDVLAQLASGKLPQEIKKAWAITRPDGVTYFYDALGFPTSIEDRNRQANKILYEYENVLAETGAPCPLDPLLNKQVVAPGVCEPRLARVIDPAGADAPAGSDLRTERTLELNYYPTDALAAEAGRIHEILDHKLIETGGGPKEKRKLVFSYRPGGLLASITEAANSSDSRTTSFGYDTPDLGEHPELETITDPRGATTTLQYAPSQALGELGRKATEITNRAGNTRHVTYGAPDGDDHVVTTVQDGRGESTSYELDDRDRPVKLTDALGTVTELEWDSDNNVVKLTEAANEASQKAVTSYAYNQNGLLTAQADPLGRTTYLFYENSAGVHRSTVAGDDNTDGFVSDLVAIRRPTGSVWSFGLEPTTATDGTPTTTGNVVSRTDPLNHTATTTYSDHGEVTSETDEEGGRTTYSDFDPNGLPRQVVTPVGNQTGGHPLDNRYLYVYDEVGNPLQVVDPRGADDLPPGPLAGQVGEGSPFTTTLDYDAFDELTREHVARCSAEPDCTTEQEQFITRTYAYDKNGNQTQLTDGNGDVTAMGYTPMDRLEQQTVAVGTPDEATTRYCYDQEEGLVKRIAPVGVAQDCQSAEAYTTRFVLDELGRRVATVRQSTGEDDLITSYAYDLRGNVVAMIDPRRNIRRTPEQAVSAAAQGTDLRMAYLYDAADELVVQSEDPSGLNLRTAYRYDLNGNRVRVIAPRGLAGGADPATFTTCIHYDAADRVDGVIDPLGNYTRYGRDDVGRIVAEERPNGTRTTTNGDYTVDYAYDANGELVSRSIPWRSGQYGMSDTQLDAIAVTYQRDAVGDPIGITDARGNSFTNSFYDTGELRETERPSFWKLDWSGGTQGAGAAPPVAGDSPGGMTPAPGAEPAGLAPDPGVHFAAQAGGAQADLAMPVGGPQLVERTGFEAQTAKEPAPPDPSQPQSPGDFGRVDPEPLPDMLPLAGKTTFAYDGEMRLARVTDTAGSSSQIAYDHVGRITQKRWQLTSTDSIEHSYEYDDNGNLTDFADGTIYDGQPVAWHYEYDQFDRVIQERAPGAKSSPDDTIEAEVTDYSYDLNGNLTSRRTPRRAGDFSFSFAYDQVDRLLTETNPAGETWAYTYDPNGNRVTETTPRGTATPAAGDFVYGYAYDPADRLIEITDPLGAQTRFSYDANGNRTRIEEPGAARAPGAAIEPQITKIIYDGRDLPWRTTTGAGTPAYGNPGGEARTTITEYDPNGNLVRTINPAGAFDYAPYDGELQNGSLDQKDPELRDITKKATVQEYDADNLMTNRYLPWDAGGETDKGIDQAQENQRRYRQQFSYDSRGRVEQIKYPRQFAGPGGQEGEVPSVRYTYYDTGWVKSSSDLDPGGSIDQAISYSYDGQGNQVAWHDLNGGRDITRSFYPDGTLQIRQADGGGDHLEYRYFYNENRSLVRFEDIREPAEPNRTTVIDRDAAEREHVVNEQWAAGRDTLFGYDAAGNTTLRRTDGSWSGGDGYSGGSATSFTYDALDRETEMSIDPAQSSDRVTRTSYYPSGDVMERDKAFSAVVEDFFYATDGRLLQMKRDDTDSTADTPKNQSYTYDVDGNRTSDERGTYLYDSRDRLVRWTRGQGPSSGTYVSYKLNGSGAILQQTDSGPDPDTSFTYLGNRLLSSTESATTTQYEYNDFGSVTCAHVQGQSCSAQGSVTYEYDPFERRTGSQGAGEGFSYAYDALDRRDTKTKQGHTYELAYVGTSDLLSKEADEGQKTKFYDYDSRGVRQGQTVSDAQGASYNSYALDANGSVENLEHFDGSKIAGSTYEYDPYGELENEGQLQSEATQNPFRFEAFYYDSGVKTYDMLARSYLPEIGRFLSQDRFEDAGADLALQSDPLTQNRYAFAGGNPISNIEWDGHCGGAGGACRPSDTVKPPPEGTINKQDWLEAAYPEAYPEASPGGFGAEYQQTVGVPYYARPTPQGLAKALAEFACQNQEDCREGQVSAQLLAEIVNPPSLSIETLDPFSDEIAQGMSVRSRQRYAQARMFAHTLGAQLSAASSADVIADPGQLGGTGERAVLEAFAAALADIGYPGAKHLSRALPIVNEGYQWVTGQQNAETTGLHLTFDLGFGWEATKLAGKACPKGGAVGLGCVAAGGAAGTVFGEQAAEAVGEVDIPEPQVEPQDPTRYSPFGWNGFELECC